MKKIIGVLLISVFALAAASSAQLSIGVDPVANAGSLALRYDFAGGIIGKVGVNYNNVSVGGASTSTTGYGVQLAYALPMMIGKVKPLIGLNYSSDGASTATTNTSLRLGGEVEVASGVLLSAGITAYNSASTGGGTATSTISTGGAWIGIYCNLM
ncbi:MAG: hypothetical protein JW873_02680 [Candidatus Saganbacteria bacterium]|nr:hypothetical protein [Candidatus Saganbacteria bacterium]